MSPLFTPRFASARDSLTPRVADATLSATGTTHVTNDA
jgi:hypothetical protein